MKTVLRVENITIRFGGLAALADVSLDVKEGEIHGLIGPNGSGKSTLFNVISGLYTQDGGHIYLLDRPLDGIEPYRRVEMGINRSFQHQRTFKGMTVLENVMMGQHKTLHYGPWGCVLNRKAARAEESLAIDRSLECLEFVNLSKLAERNINDLSYVEQRLVEIARALASEHILMLLDEPAAGLSPSTITEIDNILMKVRKEKGVSILIIEHVLSLVLNISDRITVLNEGKRIAQGTPDEIRHSKLVEEAYVGKVELLEGVDAH
jgi:branched-chain amino acid transport system ATP-binding protein